MTIYQPTDVVGYHELQTARCKEDPKRKDTEQIHKFGRHYYVRVSAWSNSPECGVNVGQCGRGYLSNTDRSSISTEDPYRFATERETPDSYWNCMFIAGPEISILAMMPAHCSNSDICVERMNLTAKSITRQHHIHLLNCELH